MKRKFLRGKTLCATFCSTMPVIAVLMGGGALAPAEASAEGIDWNSVQYVTLETADGGYVNRRFLWAHIGRTDGYRMATPTTWFRKGSISMA